MTDMHREAFESWVKGEGYCTERYFGKYTPGIETRWEGWCAALRYRDEQARCDCAYTCKFCRDEQEKQA